MGGKTKTKSTSTTSMPAWQEANVRYMQDQARGLFDQGGPQMYGGATYIPATQNELLGRQMQGNFAQGQGQQMVNQAISSNNAFMDPSLIFNPGQIAGFAGMQNDGVRRITENLTTSILPRLRGSSVGNGMYGSSTGRRAETAALRETNRAVGEFMNQSNLQGAQFLGGLRENALNRAPGMFQLGLQPGGVMGQIGQAERADEQAAAKDAYDRWMFEQMRPYNNVDWYRQTLGQAGTYGGTQTNESQSKTGFGVGQALGLGLTAAGMFMNPAAGLAAGAGGSMAPVPGMPGSVGMQPIQIPAAFQIPQFQPQQWQIPQFRG